MVALDTEVYWRQTRPRLKVMTVEGFTFMDEDEPPDSLALLFYSDSEWGGDESKLVELVSAHLAAQPADGPTMTAVDILLESQCHARTMSVDCEVRIINMLVAAGSSSGRHHGVYTAVLSPSAPHEVIDCLISHGFKTEKSYWHTSVYIDVALSMNREAAVVHLLVDSGESVAEEGHGARWYLPLDAKKERRYPADAVDALFRRGSPLPKRSTGEHGWQELDAEWNDRTQSIFDQVQDERSAIATALDPILPAELVKCCENFVISASPPARAVPPS